VADGIAGPGNLSEIVAEGSGKTPALTCAASTVLGTDVFSQPSALYIVVEITSPVSLALHADINCQLSRSGVVFSPVIEVAAARKARGRIIAFGFMGT
jgi:hypothetical protein